MVKKRQKRTGQLTMEPALWRLLEMYAYLLSRQAGSPIGQARTAGAVVAKFLLAHQERILRDYPLLKAQELGSLAGLDAADPQFRTLLSDLRELGYDREGEERTCSEESGLISKPHGR